MLSRLAVTVEAVDAALFPLGIPESFETFECGLVRNVGRLLSHVLTLYGRHRVNAVASVSVWPAA